MSIYEEFRQVLDAHPAGAPKSERIIEILKLLFTPEEIAVAVTMSFRLKSIDDIARRASLTPQDAEKLLESMAGKAVIYSKEKDGKNSYGLVPTIPGLFEFPFMKSLEPDLKKKLGTLWEEYHHEALGTAFSGNPTPLTRIVPVENSLDSRSNVHPYNEIVQLIESSKYLAVANCACRESIGKCDAPKDVCLIFDGTAKFLVERGYAKHITKEEGKVVLDRSEEAGLVHTSNNSTEKANIICNCCSCCCTILRGKTELNHPHAFSYSAYEAKVKGEDCTSCGICIDDRCPVEAIEMRDDKAYVLEEKCIGCGLCVTGCPSKAIELINRKEPPEVPNSVSEMGLKVAQEKGKLDKFIEIMKRQYS